MSQLQRVIHGARRRLWWSRWLYQFTFALAIAAGIFALTALVQRMYALPIPLTLCAVGLGGLALLASMVWLSLTKENDLQAAVRLDETAGLRERISSAWHCLRADDAFARAVVGDAEQLSAGLSPGRHLRLRAPRPLKWVMTALVACAATFLMPHGWLNQSAATVAETKAEVEDARLAVKREMQELKQFAEISPALQEFKDELEPFDKQGGGEVRRPIDVRHEAVKKIDRLEDALKQKREALQRDAAQEMRRLLRRVPGPEDHQADTQKLAQALRQGDYKTAKEELSALQEKLAKLKIEDNPETAEKLRKQLDELGKQIQQAADAQKEEEKLQQLSLNEPEKERLLEQLKKGDLEQVRKALEKSGLTPEQAQKMAEKMRQRQQAGELAKKLAQAMQQAAQAGNTQSDASASESFQMAEAQLGELEMMDQQMAELDAAMESLAEAKQALDKPCSACKGKGEVGKKSCSTCQGLGRKKGAGGMGRNMAQGEGGLAPEEATAVDFKKEKQKVTTGKGAIIGQVLVAGEQVKGSLNPQLGDMATAAERDASDRINRDRVPRQYQKAVKTYFSTMRESMGGVAPDPAPESTVKPQAEGEAKP